MKRLGALTLGALLAASSTFGGDIRAAARPGSPIPSPGPAVAGAPPPDAGMLYSAHARRLVQSYLRLRLLELREADLDRVRAVIERRLGADSLLVPPSSAAVVR